MTIEKNEQIFQNESGTKTLTLDFNANNVCIQAGFSVCEGSVTVSGRLYPDDEDHELGFIDLATGDIRTVAGEGVYSLLGAELLHSVTFTAQSNTTAYAKFIY